MRDLANGYAIANILLFFAAHSYADFQTRLVSLIGEHVELPCHAVSADWHYVSSSSSDRRLIASHGELQAEYLGRYVINCGRRSFNLVILRVQLNDSGIYTCDHSDSHAVSTTIHLFTQEGNARVSTNADTRRLGSFRNGSIRIPCSTHHPDEVDWIFTRYAYSRDERICSNGKISRVYLRRFSIDNTTAGQFDLIINAVQSDDAGLYVCLEKGGLLPAVTVAVINIYEIIPSNDTATCAGGSATILCRTNVPGPVIWLRVDGNSTSTVTVKPSSRISMQRIDTFTYVLSVASVQLSDGGLYFCSNVEFLHRTPDFTNIATRLNVHNCSENDVATISVDESRTKPATGLIVGLNIGVAATIVVIIIVVVCIYRHKRNGSHGGQQTPTPPDTSMQLLRSPTTAV